MWLLVRDQEQLTPEQRQYREVLCDLSSPIATAYTLAQRFVQIILLHQVENFDSWLQEALHCSVPPLRHFVRSLQQDYAAVRASLVFDWSSGQVEG
jgi:transposase